MAVSKWSADIGGMEFKVRGNVEGDVSFSAYDSSSSAFAKLTPLEALALSQALSGAAIDVMFYQKENDDDGDDSRGNK